MSAKLNLADRETATVVEAAVCDGELGPLYDLIAALRAAEQRAEKAEVELLREAERHGEDIAELMAEHQAELGEQATPPAPAPDAVEREYPLPKPLPPEHPESVCQLCGRPNVIWWTDNETWRAVMHGEGIVCPTCFIRKATGVLASDTWQVAPGSLANEVQRMGVAEKFTGQALATLEADAVERVVRWCYSEVYGERPADGGVGMFGYTRKAWDDGLANWLARAELAKATRQCDALANESLANAARLMVAERELAAARAEAARLREYVDEMASEPCVYGDNCPDGTRHGRCLFCKARRALALRALATRKEVS